MKTLHSIKTHCRVDLVLDGTDEEISLVWHTKTHGRVETDCPLYTFEQRMDDVRELPKEEIQGAYNDAIIRAVDGIKEAFAGETFSHFADAGSGDNSIIVMRQRTAKEMSAARQKVVYRDLSNAGLTHEQIGKLVNVL